jgi:hypothetical protein
MPDAWFSRTKRAASPGAGAPAVLLDAHLTRQALADDLLPRLRGQPPQQGAASLTAVSPGRIFAHGYELGLRIELDKADNALGVHCDAELPMGYDKALEPQWRLDFRLGLQLPADAASNAYSHTKSATAGGYALGMARSVHRFYAFPAGRSITRIEDWDALLLVGGALRLRAEIHACK